MDEDKTKAQLINELRALRRRVAGLEKDKGTSTDPSKLRRRAEERLGAKPSETHGSRTEDVQRLLHELEVHQVELEMQNSELRNALVQVEESRGLYSDLYDFAPVGYLTLDEKGIILRANLTLARQLGIERSYLINKPLLLYIPREDKGVFFSHLNNAVKLKTLQSCEVRFKKGDEQFHVLMDTIFIEDASGRRLRTSVTDITERKRTEEALRRSNNELDSTIRALSEKTENMEEVNAALRVLLRQREEDRKELVESVLVNVGNLILPYMEKLKQSQLNSAQMTWMKILESHLNEITSSFGRTLAAQYANLTPTEIRIAALIRDDRSTTQIAELFGISEKTVCRHRDNIRKKLGLRGGGTNLKTHLLGLK